MLPLIRARRRMFRTKTKARAPTQQGDRASEAEDCRALAQGVSTQLVPLVGAGVPLTTTFVVRQT
jgi:hypothetical protein